MRQLERVAGACPRASTGGAGSASASTQRSHRPAQSGSVPDAGHEAPAPLALLARRALSTSTLHRVRRRRRRRRCSSRSDTMKSIGRSRAVRVEQRGRRGPCAVSDHVRRRATCRSPCPCASARAPRSPVRAPSAGASQRCASASSAKRSTGGEGLQVHGLGARARQVPPQFVGRHRQDRRQQARQPVAHEVHRGLRRAPRLRRARRRCTSGPWTRRRRTRSGPP